MSAFDHTPSPTTDVPPPENTRNARYGLILFAIYSLFYAAFMVLNAFTPKVMEVTVLGGINLAIVYGLGLIVLAFVLSLLYAWMCRATQSHGEGR
jgi:uncharacterized membrane protein (DUF485 family)